MNGIERVLCFDLKGHSTHASTFRLILNFEDACLLASAIRCSAAASSASSSSSSSLEKRETFRLSACFGLLSSACSSDVTSCSPTLSKKFGGVSAARSHVKFSGDPAPSSQRSCSDLKPSALRKNTFACVSSCQTSQIAAQTSPRRANGRSNWHSTS